MAAHKRTSSAEIPPGHRPRVATSSYDFLDDIDYEGDNDDAAPPPVVVDPVSTKATLCRVQETYAPEQPLTTTDVPFELSREPDRVVDVGEMLAVMPSAAIEALATECAYTFLTEARELTEARVELKLFEQHTRCLRGTRGTHWVRRLTPWAGMLVATREPAVPTSAPLRCMWPAADNPHRTYSLAIFELRPSFYVAAVLRTDQGCDDAIYVGAFYMQSEQSHMADSAL